MANHVTFREGMEVEVRRQEPELESFWYPAKILDAPPEQDGVHVQYDTLVSEADESKQPKAFVKLSNVRLRPPEEDCMDFVPGDRVEALFEAGWLKGTITGVFEVGESYKFIVFFLSMQKKVELEKMNLRHSGTWIEGEWIPEDFRETSDMKFPSGMLVEVSGDEHGFFGAWFTATIVSGSRAGNFEVFYDYPKSDDGFKLLETVASERIRPYPPDVPVEAFSLYDEVEAPRLSDRGWGMYVGLISRILEGPKYTVYFPNTDEKDTYEPEDLRLHQEWINNKWIHAAQG